MIIVELDGHALAELAREFEQGDVRKLRIAVDTDPDEHDGVIKWKINEGIWDAGVPAIKYGAQMWATS